MSDTLDEMNNEDFYDDKIAPILRDLAEKCQSKKMNFVADIEFSPGEHGVTFALEAEKDAETKMVYWAARSKGNIDAFLMAVLKDAKKNGHGSIYLALLGVPASHDPKYAANGGLSVVTITKGG